ncbi:hypothetical protein [Williamsia sp. 1138]|uniref:hypothetical protein n=1 Tax=Williamsia sp. 1138 TaxID=1903117 RepID=UPI00143D0C37|nr:hypothetical protein [Williamsia sp. 1138]
MGTAKPNETQKDDQFATAMNVSTTKVTTTNHDTQRFMTKAATAGGIASNCPS